MCVACGQELCGQCKGCHKSECERYIEPTEECEIDGEDSRSIGQAQANFKQQENKHVNLQSFFALFARASQGSSRTSGRVRDGSVIGYG